MYIYIYTLQSLTSTPRVCITDLKQGFLRSPAPLAKCNSFSRAAKYLGMFESKLILPLLLPPVKKTKDEKPRSLVGVAKGVADATSWSPFALRTHRAQKFGTFLSPWLPVQHMATSIRCVLSRSPAPIQVSEAVPWKLKGSKVRLVARRFDKAPSHPRAKPFCPLWRGLPF